MKKTSFSNQDTKFTVPKAKAPRNPKASVGNQLNTPIEKSPARKIRVASKLNDAASRRLKIRY